MTKKNFTLNKDLLRQFLVGAAFATLAVPLATLAFLAMNGIKKLMPFFLTYVLPFAIVSIALFIIAYFLKKGIKPYGKSNRQTRRHIKQHRF